MEMEITLPNQVPVMTLPGMVFFPQAMLPLHIFEPRYRHMLRDVLSSNRLLAIAGLDPHSRNPDTVEPPYRVASVGIIRACKKNDNGTSNLLLQGLCRVEITSVVREEPYRLIQIRTLTSEPGALPGENQTLRAKLARLIQTKGKLSSGGSAQLAKFLRTVDDPEAFIDIAAFNLCDNSTLKQQLLETLDIHRRLRLFDDYLQREVETLKLQHRLQGNLPDERIAEN